MGQAATIVAERKALLARTESLVREFHPVLPAGAVIRAVTRCRAELLRAGVRGGLAGATEAQVRIRLGDAVRAPRREPTASADGRLPMARTGSR